MQHHIPYISCQSKRKGNEHVLSALKLKYPPKKVCVFFPIPRLKKATKLHPYPELEDFTCKLKLGSCFSENKTKLLAKKKKKNPVILKG